MLAQILSAGLVLHTGAAADQRRQDLDTEDHDNRREIEAAQRRQDATQRSQHGLGEHEREAVDAGHRAVRRQREPTQDDPGHEHDEVDLEEETD